MTASQQQEGNITNPALCPLHPHPYSNLKPKPLGPSSQFLSPQPLYSNSIHPNPPLMPPTLPTTPPDILEPVLSEVCQAGLTEHLSHGNIPTGVTVVTNLICHNKSHLSQDSHPGLVQSTGMAVAGQHCCVPDKSPSHFFSQLSVSLLQTRPSGADIGVWCLVCMKKIYKCERNNKF